MNTTVSFSIAKLLKEKGFDEPCREGWVNYLASFTGETRMPDDESNLVLDRLGNTHLIERPIIADIVMWLYEKHGIWIQPLPYDTITAAKEWTATILSLNWGEDKEVHYEYKLGGLNSPTEAYEAAIEYILKNLI